MSEDITIILIEFAVVVIGLAVTALLFYRLPLLPAAKKDLVPFPSVSVIIPARNEADVLPLLLQDLSAQTLQAAEIIVADDASEDATAQIATSYGARLVSLHKKPQGWTGKSWACQQGAELAKGDLLLFLDADVRLGKDGILRLMQAYANCGCTLSVQPYHKTEQPYEQLSIMFNLVQIAGNGSGLPKPINIGLCGPVMLISRTDYMQAGGHAIARGSVIEDLTLGQELTKAGIPYQLYMGDADISYRMYADGLKSLLRGWAKNLASGAAKTSLLVFLMVFFWITSLTSVPYQIIKFAFTGNLPWLALYALLYLVWVLILFTLTRRVGRFQAWAIIFYPPQMIILLAVFAVSLFRKIFGLNTTWKGR
ncbi:MAG TPA: glycosyltransferase family 2 protein, partial [Anaerolineaceae bacterium]|nr:glycosyltransferase family 2 protein [Anaerolineaceae bacterium]